MNFRDQISEDQASGSPPDWDLCWQHLGKQDDVLGAIPSQGCDPHVLSSCSDRQSGQEHRRPGRAHGFSLQDRQRAFLSSNIWLLRDKGSRWTQMSNIGQMV